MANPYGVLFRDPAFRRFGLGFLVSVIGDELTRVAFVWFVYEKTGSAEALGLLMLCFTGPIVVGGFVAGWLLDRFDRRQVMMIDNLVRGLFLALIPVLHFLGALEVWHVYVAAAVHGLLLMISLAGTPTMILALVPKEHLATANALETLGYSVAGVLGPALAGILVATIGAPATVLLDVVSYLLFALVLLRLRLALPAPAKRTAAPIGAAVRLLFGNPVLTSTTFMFLAFNILTGSIPVWLPIHVETSLGGGPELYGALLSIAFAGQVATTLLVGQLGARVPLGLGIAIAQTLSGALMILVVFGSSAIAAGIILFLFGIVVAPLTPWAQTLRMAIIPEEMRGRAFALLRMLMQSGRPIGGALAGLVLPALGVAGTVMLVGAAAMAGGIAGLLTRPLRDAGRPD
ncbi:MAG: MFS transporter [Alphaproteobacteria bacterium]|nr:MFS transporter [Alphaproteobacteria bacterium]